ncbi:MAG TPA: HAD-IA family hydrolase [Candidatus Binatia bacterium]|jgi:putative hydrolase of the HAD superfamily
MKFEAIIFDLFGTLVDDFVSSVGQMHQEMAAALGVPYEQFMQFWGQTAKMRIIGAFDSVESNIEYVCDAMKASPRAEQIEKAVEIRLKYIRQALEPKPDAINTPSELKNRGHKIGLLSNCSIEIPLLWQETAFADLFDTTIFSSRERLKKPDARIYHLACDRLGARPEACLYIADGEDHELAAAAEVGLYPVLIRTSVQKTSRSHQEAKEWEGTTITSLPEVLQLVEAK